MSNVVVSPPATEVWWTPATVKANVLKALRLAGSGDIDDARIEGLIPVAGFLINSHIDRVSDPAPVGYVASPALLAAVERITIELYRDPTLIGEGGTVFITDASPIGETLKRLAGPSRERFGVA